MNDIKIIVLQQDQKDIFKNIKHKLKVIPANILDDVPLREPLPLNTPEMFDELADVIEQHENKKVSDSLQKVADKNPMRMFKVYCKKMGLSPNWGYVEQVDKDLVHIIIELKNYYNRPRPTDMSLSLGMCWKGDDLSSAQTPSYPSGHATQAYMIGFILANQYPDRKTDILRISQIISDTRVDRGVHFPSDVHYGIFLAKYISDKLINIV